MTETRPGLVPLTFGDDHLALMRPLAGVSLDTEVTHWPPSFREAMLFTHRGLSGPAILQISSYWREGPITLNLLPDLGRRGIPARPQTHPPESRTAHHSGGATAATSGPDAGGRTARGRDGGHARSHAARSGATIAGLDRHPHRHRRLREGRGHRRRHRHARPVVTNHASHKVPGLFAIGEAVDVTGWLGGYNFQWAWASGWCAGEAA